MEKILVGIDGSDHARRAAEWAVRHASPDDEIVLAIAFELTTITGFEATAISPAEVEADARDTVETLADELRAEGGPKIGTYVHHGHAGHFLINRSRDADLVVVGRRGRGGFFGARLGSCSNYVVHHAACPVVVIRDGDEEQG